MSSFDKACKNKFTSVSEHIKHKGHLQHCVLNISIRNTQYGNIMPTVCHKQSLSHIHAHLNQSKLAKSYKSVLSMTIQPVPYMHVQSLYCTIVVKSDGWSRKTDPSPFIQILLIIWF